MTCVLFLLKTLARRGRPAISPDQTLLAVFNCLDGFDIYSMGSTVEMPQLLHTFRVEVSKNLLLPVVFIDDGKSIVLGSANGSVLITSVTNVTSRVKLPHGRRSLTLSHSHSQSR